MVEKKRLLILGTGNLQLPLIKVAKRMGVVSLATGMPGGCSGFEFAEESVYVDISDTEAVLEAARKADIDGVVACEPDTAVAVAGRVSELLGLPGPSVASLHTVSNKWKMKQALAKGGVQIPSFLCIRSEQDLKGALELMQYPVFFKATDQTGREVTLHCSAYEQAYENYNWIMEKTQKDYCVIEECIGGEVFSVIALIQNGKIVHLLPFNIEVSDDVIAAPIGYSVPFRGAEVLESQIWEQTERAVRTVGLNNCPVYLEFEKKGREIYVIDLAPYFRGIRLPELASIYYGVDYYEMIARVALGLETASFFPQGISGTPCLTHAIISQREGVVARIYNYNVSDENTLEVSVNISPGDRVRKFADGEEQIGQVMLKGNTLEHCEGRLREILSNIKIQMEGDLPLIPTPIHPLSPHLGNKIYVKREDLLPFSFGGNKVRFAQAFLEDMERGGYGGMVIYGNYHSNLCRIFSAACKRKGIPCNMVHNVEDTDGPADGVNGRLIRSMGVREFTCHKKDIADAVRRAMDDLKKRGVKPYYIYGDCYGKGNEWVPMEACADVYEEICRQEKEMGLHFDFIFVAAGTGMTFSGLVAGHLMKRDGRKIVGISVNRKEARACEVTEENLRIYEERKGLRFPQDLSREYVITDKYLGEGYGIASQEVERVIREAYERDGISFDGTYTGKAFYGMERYLEDQNITGKNVLFLHTGGIPLFFEEVPKLFTAEKMREASC